MTDNTLSCGECGKDFSSWDDLANHMVKAHDSNRANLFLSDEPPQQAEVVEPVNEDNQQNLLAPLIQNPTESEQLVRAIGEELSTNKRITIRGNILLAGIATGVVLLVLAAVTFLTYQEIISGSVFAFALGTLIGYLLSFLEDFR
jgi:uncharacterized membrane protein YvbJ